MNFKIFQNLQDPFRGIPVKENSLLHKIFFITLSYYENKYRKLQQKENFRSFQKNSKFEGKTGLPHPSKFLTNLKFLEMTFLSKVLVFLINFASIIIYFYGNKTNY